MGEPQAQDRWEVFDEKVVLFMRTVGVPFLRYALAVVFIWFGALKIFGKSPATDLVTQTVYWFDPAWFVPALGVWEVAIGLCFLFRPLLRLGIALLAPQMVGTLLPLVLVPEAVYQNGNILLLTNAGQYIVKNLLIIGAALVVGASVRYKKVVLVEV